MKTNSLRTLSTVVALGVAALSFSAHAQTEPAKGNGPVQRAEDATVRTAKKAGHATAHAGEKVAGGVRKTGNKIGSHLPPAKNPSNLDSQGVPKVTNGS
ncbi:hypothetical protein GT347_04310 [Xylophilus rhododendri]|uniref:Uncharacterized protein n=1 Tax=Xylophilus rhododendri TaxID=2697032 RepID=A0A857J2I7_9BURK|nr:hypothetical protein [Xylophilus rhododendri]QHI97271.1 hypothetical protein GT347_04310 [Xylophilus rhododendri]